MAIQQSSTWRAIPAIAQSAGKVAAKLICVAKWLEVRALQSPTLGCIPVRVRKLAFVLLKVIVVCLVASFAVSASVCVIVLFVLAALPFPSEEVGPSIVDSDHPDHYLRYPELYDEYGSLK